MANYEPEGFTQTDRDVAPKSIFHSDGPRKLVTVTMTATVNIPVERNEEDIFDRLAWVLTPDP